MFSRVLHICGQVVVESQSPTHTTIPVSDFQAVLPAVRIVVECENYPTHAFEQKLHLRIGDSSPVGGDGSLNSHGIHAGAIQWGFQEDRNTAGPEYVVAEERFRLLDRVRSVSEVPLILLLPSEERSLRIPDRRDPHRPSWVPEHPVRLTGTPGEPSLLEGLLGRRRVEREVGLRVCRALAVRDKVIDILPSPEDFVDALDAATFADPFNCVVPRDAQYVNNDLSEAALPAAGKTIECAGFDVARPGRVCIILTSALDVHVAAGSGFVSNNA